MKKNKPTDGLGPLEIQKIRSAIRLVWQRSHARRLVIKRCTGPDGFMYCEICKQRTPQFKVDHIVNCGDLDGGYISRMFINSKGLMGLCHLCHKIKTAQEKANKKALTK